MWIPLDVCLLNDEGQLLYTSSFLSQLHLVYKRLEVWWCIYAEGVLLFAWWGHFDNPAATTLDVLPHSLCHRCLQYVPETTRRVWLFSWGFLAKRTMGKDTLHPLSTLNGRGCLHEDTLPHHHHHHHPISNRERNVRTAELLLQRSLAQKVSTHRPQEFYAEFRNSTQDFEIQFMVGNDNRASMQTLWLWDRVNWLGMWFRPLAWDENLKLLLKLRI